MKISHFPKWCGSVCNSISIVEVMIILAIIGLLTAIVIPNFIKFKERSEKNRLEAQEKAKADFKVGDTVTIKGINQKGTVNYFPDNGYVDILIIDKEGHPTILKGINLTLITK